MKSEFLLFYFVIINICGAFINLSDKRRAMHGAWRISEKSLWSIAALGGAPLSYVTMKLIRHKTKHKAFMVLMPVLALLQMALFAYLYIITDG